MASLGLGKTTDSDLVKALCDVGIALTSVEEWEGRVDVVLEHVAGLLPVDLAAVLLGRDEGILLLHRFTVKAQALQDEAIANTAEHYRLLAGQEPRPESPRLLILDRHAASRGEESHGEPAGTSYLSLPLLGPDEVIGILHIASLQERAYDLEDLRLLSVFAAQLGSYLAHVVTRGRPDAERESSLAELAHEIRNPLATASGFTQLLERRLSENADGKTPELELAASVRAQLKRMNDLLEAMLSTARESRTISVVDKRAVDLAALSRQVAEMVQATTDRHTLKVIADEGCNVLGDAGRLEQVLLNLLSNAVKYSPDGGPVEVRLVRDEPERQVAVAVVDCGIGIDQVEQRNLFRRYYRADTATGRRVGGSGLGLYISAEIVSRHGGQLRVDSEPGKGSTFYFALPIAE